MNRIEQIYQWISSMKMGFILLALIGSISVVGSVLFPNIYYHSVVFQMSLILLLLNMFFCTINQVARFSKGLVVMKKNATFLRRIGILTLHAGVVLVLIGMLINSFWGHQVNIRLAEGDQVQVSRLGFDQENLDIKLKSFEILYNNDGSPSQFASQLQVSSGSISQPYAISVNHPLSFRGLKVYQQSYDYVIALEKTSRTGETTKATLREGALTKVAETDKVIKVFQYVPNYDPKFGMNTKTLRPDNPRVLYAVYQNSAHLKSAMASLNEKVEIEPGVTFTFTEVKYLSGLTIKHDPGLPIAALGGLLLMVGVCAGLFIRTKRPPEENNSPSNPPSV